MRKAMRHLYVWLGGALVLAVVLQFYFAGVGVFTFPASSLEDFPRPEFALHQVNGYLIALLALVATIVAALARAPGRTIALTSALIGLVVVQVLIFVLGDVLFGFFERDSSGGAPYWVALHVLNALFILFVAIQVFRRARSLLAAERTPSELPAASSAAAATADAAAQN